MVQVRRPRGVRDLHLHRQVLRGVHPVLLHPVVEACRCGTREENTTPERRGEKLFISSLNHSSEDLVHALAGVKTRVRARRGRAPASGYEI